MVKTDRVTIISVNHPFFDFPATKCILQDLSKVIEVNIIMQFKQHALHNHYYFVFHLINFYTLKKGIHIQI